MPGESLLERLHRVAVVGDATPDESFLVLSSVTIALFTVLTIAMLLSNHMTWRRNRANRKRDAFYLSRYYVKS